MAFIKYIPKQYLAMQDLLNLVTYITRQGTNAKVSTNLRINHYDPLQYIATRWTYPHLYHHKIEKTLCYHYVLSFDLDHEYHCLRNLPVESILNSIRNLSAFQNLFVFAGAHLMSSGIPEHIHIVVDSIHSPTGLTTFIDMEQVTEELGMFFAQYDIAFSGYSYKTIAGTLKSGNKTPSMLYPGF